MTTIPVTPTNEAIAAAPGECATVGCVTSANVASVGRASTLRAELEAIMNRLPDAAQRRTACLDVMLRQRRIVGGVWFDLLWPDDEAVSVGNGEGWVVDVGFGVILG